MHLSETRFSIDNALSGLVSIPIVKRGILFFDALLVKLQRALIKRLFAKNRSHLSRTPKESEFGSAERLGFLSLFRGGFFGS